MNKNSNLNQKQVTPLPLQPLKRKRLSEEISNQIREAILNGTYLPGDKLPSESGLCEILQVGRPVVREALRFLENSGLIFVRPGSGGGAFVKKISSHNLSETFEGIVRLDKVSMEELTEARLAVELSVLPLALRHIGNADIKALEENIQEAKDALEKGIEEPKNLKFHVLLANACGNPLLIKITKALFQVLARLLRDYDYNYERKKRIMEEHLALLRLIKNKNYKSLERELARHIKDAVKYLK